MTQVSKVPASDLAQGSNRVRENGLNLDNYIPPQVRPLIQNWTCHMSDPIDTSKQKLDQIERIWSGLTLITGEAFNHTETHSFRDENAFCFSSPDVACPEFSRVKLKQNNEYHANHVTVFTPSGEKKNIILAQQPVNLDKALAHLNQLVNDHAISSIFDLRSNTDFETKGSLEYQHLLRAENQPQYTAYRQWPDHGIISSDELRNLRQKLNAALVSNDNILMHCRAGIGRSGCVAAYTSAYNYFQKNPPKNQEDMLKILAQHILELRIQRSPELIQGQHQFELVWNTLEQDFFK